MVGFDILIGPESMEKAADRRVYLTKDYDRIGKFDPRIILVILKVFMEIDALALYQNRLIIKKNVESRFINQQYE